MKCLGLYSRRHYFRLGNGDRLDGAAFRVYLGEMYPVCLDQRSELLVLGLNAYLLQAPSKLYALGLSLLQIALEAQLAG